ncbi:unnamed protein product [Lathyrus sativus]|nr:unnamed protein product [Lathyrus sativus]
MIKMKVVCAMMILVVVMVEMFSVAEGGCNAIQLSPCLPAIRSNSAPSTTCCSRLNDQKSCLCGYLKNPILKPYVNSSSSRRVAEACGVGVPNC